ncbi:4-hydroxythreonine-4-phosphate dehydrogenase [Erythrobacter sp. HI0063]|jgi:4-hydroxythreonine-4-phosphate dehydrogenase|uniref:4-hydroxythreonine-4-phosphate dehydrogenase PdxA n=1 Tax=Erythrobacter sp. HI0063 TaxID=1822240 RepID=UPI0007C204E9|nr:4-hydroxythreonine-4-phosphate dehydrogenase PdxA [Erythrobacter sp. HI0063]KZY57916.1 4-hydroxythreonine-4-phosphate dehydrogenase [Erythrobacter sp. HI0063]
MPPLAVSLGDPAGIGPEIIVASWARRRESKLAPFFVVGGTTVLEKAAAVRDLACPIVPIDDAAEANDAFDRGLPVLGAEDGTYRPGVPDDAGAALALGSLAGAVRMALLGKASAAVTAPVSKAHLARVGFEFPGQTEFLAAACGLGPNDVVMMLAGPSLRAVPVTVHCALADVPRLLDKATIAAKARITAAALTRDFGIAAPRIAICGLNPHAGEGGKFGSEERDIIAPAIETLRAEGMAVTGPHPADALFTPRARQTYDAALAMYHDQALVPIKALDFDEGVNVTLGLPIVRTSPDHGTAFDIAGKGLADPGAMIAALRMASAMAERRAKP